MSTGHTPGPWQYVEATQNHGPYITSDHGSTLADCYIMSHPHMAAVCNGGPSKPVHFMHEMAGPNARLMSLAPEMLEALRVFLGSDPKIQVAAGGNPIYVDRFLDNARSLISRAEGKS